MLITVLCIIMLYRLRFSKAVKKLVTSDEHEKLKEEMAWQVAEMIVRDVTRYDDADDAMIVHDNAVYPVLQCHDARKAREGED